jgi:hypothetical protein
MGVQFVAQNPVSSSISVGCGDWPVCFDASGGFFGTMRRRKVDEELAVSGGEWPAAPGDGKVGS